MKLFSSRAEPPRGQIQATARPSMAEDVLRLRRAFDAARRLHHDTVESVARQALLRRSWVEGLKVGEGRHFVTYAVAAPAASGDTSDAMQLCVHVAHENFYGARIESGVAAWRQALQALMRLALPLVPPIHMLAIPEQIATVMPFGSEPLTSAAQHWQPIEKILAETCAKMAQHHIELGDVPQGRCWQGIPFLYDFSDLLIRRD